jgi:hypothetical protein
MSIKPSAFQDSNKVAAPPSSNNEPNLLPINNSPDGAGSGRSSISSWKAVQTVRKSTIWSIITWPFSAFSRLCTKIFYAVRGRPVVADRTLQIEVPNLFFGSTLTHVRVEEAISKGWITYENVMIKLGDKVSDDTAKVEGWFVITIDVVPRFFGSAVPTKMTLMHAVKNGHITVDEAVKAGHMTAAQANKALWIVKKTSEKATK